MTRPLRLVATTDRPLDIHALIRADILKRDWDAVMIAAERRGPVQIGDARKYAWR